MYPTNIERPPFLSKKFIDAGLVILSKYPIVDRDGIVFDFGNQIDSWAAKQVIYAKVHTSTQITSNQIRFKSHLTNSFTSSQLTCKRPILTAIPTFLS